MGKIYPLILKVKFRRAENFQPVHFMKCRQSESLEVILVEVQFIFFIFTPQVLYTEAYIIFTVLH